MSVSGRGRESQITDYDSRRTGDRFSDRGSIPLRSTIREVLKSRDFPYFMPICGE